MNKEKEEISFIGIPIRRVYGSEGFKVFALDVDCQKYPFVKLNKFNNASIVGDLPELNIGCEYNITAIEEDGKYGVSYRVIHIKPNIPTDEEGIKKFLSEVLTKNQADVLFKIYPDIVERVRENRLDDIDLSKLNGIGKARFEKIVENIVENFALVDLVAEFGGIISLSVMRKINKKYSSVEKIKEHLIREPYKTLTSISGIGYKSADFIVCKMQDEKVIDFGYDVKTSVDRCLACIAYILEKNEEDGNTKANLASVRKQCFELVPECAHNFASAVSDEKIWYDKQSMEIALAKTHYYEKYIANAVVNAVKTSNEWECDTSKYKHVDEFELSDEQLNAVNNICKHTISILNGRAGTGKSMSMKAVVKMLEDNDKSCMLLAPTGRAGKVLADFTGKYASTIHRGLGYNPEKGWTFGEDYKLDTDVVIVDEFSMVDVNLFYHLVSAIDFRYTKLMMIGDDSQLPSVGSGNLLHDFIESGIVPTTTLGKVFRYSEGGLMKVATDIRDGKRYLSEKMKNKTTVFGDNKDYIYIDMIQEKMPKKACDIYKGFMKSGNKPEDIQLICAKNVGAYGTTEMNKRLQEIANSNYGSKKCMEVGGTTFYDDDIVIQKKNNYDAKIYNNVIHFDESGDVETAFVANGEIGKIVDVLFDSVIINFGGILVEYDKKNMSNVRLGYAITAHSSQGSSIDNIIIMTPKADTYMLNSNLLYVALTRMKKKCVHIGSYKTVNIAIGKKANLVRHTFMEDMLKTFYNLKEAM